MRKTRKINRIEVETWTRDEPNAGTNDRIDCVITFKDGRYFQQRLNNPNVNDFQRGQRDRFRLNLNTPRAATADVINQNVDSIKSIQIKKIGGNSKWKCGAVGIRVNDVVVLSRYVTADLQHSGESFTVDLRTDGKLDGLEIKITTPNVARAGTDDPVYCNVVFSDTSVLYSPNNLLLDLTGVDDFQPNNPYSTYSYLLPLPHSLIDKYPTDISEVYIRKSGSDGWLLGAARLYTNGEVTPLIANRAINQLLDNSKAVFKIRDWSSRSILKPDDTTSASLPMDQDKVKCRILGPVLGHITDSSAKILYRVEREGSYMLRIYLYGSNTIFNQITASLHPTGSFEITGLQANTAYSFKFFHILNNAEISMPEGDGSFRTFPLSNRGVKFSFGIGSCARNSDDINQLVWTQVRKVALDPSVDPLNARTNDLRFFIHMGDTFYFFDGDLLDTDLAKNQDVLAAALAANLSSRKNTNFLDMARRVPCYAVWDDHDFRQNNKDSVNFPSKDLAKKAFLSYWGNQNPLLEKYGLTTRLSYGNVDLYLMDGRYLRNKHKGEMFTTEQCNWILNDIKKRGARRLRILISGSTWNHTLKERGKQFLGIRYEKSHKEPYGNNAYKSEREAFYKGLSNLIGSTISGLVFMSGNIHQNEIFEIKLPGNRVAPEIVCSPLTKNGKAKKKHSIKGERKWSSRSVYGFASVHIDTRRRYPKWTMTVRYRKDKDGSIYKMQHYVLHNDQFKWGGAQS